MPLPSLWSYLERLSFSSFWTFWIFFRFLVIHLNDDFFQAKNYEVSGWFIAFDALITSFQLYVWLISNESKPFKCMSTANEHV